MSATPERQPLTQFLGTSWRRARAQTAAAGLANVVVKIAGLALSSLSAIVLARVLGPAGYGTYSIAFAWVLIVVVASRMGVTDLLVRETSAALERRDWATMRGLWTWARRFVVRSTAIAMLVWTVVLVWFWRTLDSELAITLAAAAVLVPALMLAKVSGGVLRGLRHVVAGQLPEEILRPAVLLAAIAAAILMRRSVSPSSVMALHAVATVLAGAWAVAMTTRWMPREAVEVKSQTIASSWRHSIWHLAAIGIFQLVNQHSDVVLLGWLAGVEEAGIYRAASQASVLIGVGLYGITLASAPHYAQLWSAGRREALQKVVRSDSISIAFLCVPPALVMIFASSMVLSLLFGADFLEGRWALTILAAGQMLNVLAGPVGSLLIMTGNENVTSRALALSGAVNIALSVMLIPAFGKVGAAFANALSIALWNFILVRAAGSSLGIQTTVWVGSKRGTS